METVQISPAASGVAQQGLTRFSFVRILLALLAVCVPVAIVLILSGKIPDKAMRAYWPPLLAAVLGTVGYVLYVRRIEQRPVAEFSGPGAGRELGRGMILGALLFVIALGVAALFGRYQYTGVGDAAVVVKACLEMGFVALIEEILFRGVLLRISERSLGSWAGLAISALIFALAHVPNDGITVLGVANTVIAGLMFGAAYLATRRLWLTVGMHFAWNFVSDGVFGLPTSGHPARGLLQGQLSGADWLTGGAYGLEASAVTLVLLMVATLLLLRQAVRDGRIARRKG